MAGQEKLELEGRKPSEASLVELVRLDLRLRLCEKLVVGLSENHSVRGDRFEVLSVEMVRQFACELV